MWPQQSVGVGARQDARLRKAFMVAAGGAVLCVVGVMMPWVKGTNSYSALSETVKGTDKFGVGWWPVVYAILAVAALYVVQRRADLSLTALGAVATGFGALDTFYVLYRHNDMTNEIKKVTGGVVSLDDGFGYYMLLLGAIGVLAGAGWFTLVARRPKQLPPGMATMPPTYPAGYPTGYYVQQPPAPPAPQPPPTSAYPPPVPAHSGGPQQPNPVYPGQAPPPPA